MTGADALSSQKTSQKPKNPVEGINCSSFSSSSVAMDKHLPIFIDWKGEQLRTASPSEQAKAKILNSPCLPVSIFLAMPITLSFVCVCERERLTVSVSTI